jgi:hypothetical protein
MKEPNRFTRTQAREEQLAAQQTGAEHAQDFPQWKKCCGTTPAHTGVAPSCTDCRNHRDFASAGTVVAPFPAMNIQLKSRR